MEGDEWKKTILIGGVLLLFSFLIVPAILAYGFVIRTIHDCLEGETAPPEFGEWRELAIQGIYGWIIGIIYLIIPFIVGAVTVGGSLTAIGSGTQTGAAAGVAGIVGGFFVTTILSLVFGYFAVVAIVNFARRGEFNAGFEFDTIKQIALSGDYFKAWLLGVGVFIVASVISGILNIIPFLGFIIGSFVLFYAQLSAAKLWADGFSAAIGDSTQSSPDLDEAAV